MSESIPVHHEKHERQEGVTEASYRSIKILGALIILFGPVLPLTILLWRLAVG